MEDEYTNPYQDNINTDKKNLTKLKAGTANQQLINAAYTGARQSHPAVLDWLDYADTGLASFTTAFDGIKKIKQAQEDQLNSQLDTKVNEMITNGFSLGTNYYDQANVYTKELRERFLAAEGNPEEQQKIKMELNLASQSIANTKQSIQDLATAWGTNPEDSDLERGGLNEDQKRVVETVFNEENAYWDQEKRSFRWRDPNDPSKTYGVEEIQKIHDLASKDFVTKEQYVKDELAERQLGIDYKLGNSDQRFDFENKMFNNESRINKKNITFLINGDFTNDGTPPFKDEIAKHPDFAWDNVNNPIFDALSKQLNKDGTLKYPNWEDDGEFNIHDLANEEDMADGVFSDEEKANAMALVYDAITNPGNGNYDFNTTKTLIAEYMTLRQEEKFYGGTKSDLAKIEPNKKDGNEWKYKSVEEYIAAGGNIGFAKDNGWTWLPEIKNDKGKVTRKAGWDYNPQNDLLKAFTEGGKYDAKQ